MPDAHPSPAAVPADAAAGLASLMSRRPHRNVPLNVRTSADIRQLVDGVKDATGAQIVEIVEYALLHTYGDAQEPVDKS